MRKEVRMTRKHNWNSFRGQRSWARCQDHVVDISRATLERFLYSLKIKNLHVLYLRDVNAKQNDNRI